MLYLIEGHVPHIDRTTGQGATKVGYGPDVATDDSNLLPRG